MLFVKTVLIRITNLFYEISFTNIQNHYPFKKSTILYFLILNRFLIIPIFPLLVFQWSNL